MKKIITILVLILFVLLIGCSKNPDVEDPNDTRARIWYGYPLDENTRASLYERWSKRLDEQFWPYSLEEYELQVEEANVIKGLGGRWITVRYLLREGHDITREEMVKRIGQTLEFYGWKREDLPKVKYVLTKIYETSKDDLYFSRGPFALDKSDKQDKSDEHISYNLAIHISDDASVLVLYCEACW